MLGRPQNPSNKVLEHALRVRGFVRAMRQNVRADVRGVLFEQKCESGQYVELCSNNCSNMFEVDVRAQPILLEQPVSSPKGCGLVRVRPRSSCSTPLVADYWGRIANLGEQCRRRFRGRHPLAPSPCDRPNQFSCCAHVEHKSVRPAAIRRPEARRCLQQRASTAPGRPAFPRPGAPIPHASLPAAGVVLRSVEACRVELNDNEHR